MPESKAENRLTEKQKRFAEEYLIDCNATQAAIRAGYSQKTANEQGSRLLANVNIKSYIDEQLGNLQSGRIADAQEVMEYLTSVMRGEQKEQTLRLIGDGCQKIDDIAVSAKDRLKAADMLGKRYGLFTDKADNNAPVTVVVNYDYGNDTEENRV